MTQSAIAHTPQSSMHIPPSVLGVILDTSNIAQQDTLKTLTKTLITALPTQQYVSTFLLATTNGKTTTIGPVTFETFEKQWQEVPWGKQSTVTPGLAAMETIIREYSTKDAPTPNFRVILLSGNPLTESEAFSAAWQKMRHAAMVIGVLGDEAHRVYDSYSKAIQAFYPSVDVIELTGDATTEGYVAQLLRMLNT